MRFPLLSLLLVLVAADAWAAPMRTLVRLVSSPPGAAVYNDQYSAAKGSGYLGKTPLTMEMDVSHPNDLYFIINGYATAHLQLQTGQTTLSVTLQPASVHGYLAAHRGLLLPVGASAVLVLLGGGYRLRQRTLALRKRLQEATASATASDSIGDYRICGVLGEGAYSKVFRVQHQGFGDFYALKLLKKAADETARTQFFREMAVGRDLRHRNLVRVFAFGDHEGAPYLVMEPVAGQTLDIKLLRGPLPLAETVSIFQQICDGLAFAHQHEIVHRDLKPANVMIEDTGTVKILDFGIARLRASTQATVGKALGTPTYMSPEHFRGQTDARSDLYSLGVMLFEALSGDVPYQAENAAALALTHATASIPSLRQFAPDLPAAAEVVVTRLLEKDAAERFQSAAAVREALDQFR